MVISIVNSISSESHTFEAITNKYTPLDDLLLGTRFIHPLTRVYQYSVAGISGSNPLTSIERDQISCGTLNEMKLNSLFLFFWESQVFRLPSDPRNMHSLPCMHVIFDSVLAPLHIEQIGNGSLVVRHSDERICYRLNHFSEHFRHNAIPKSLNSNSIASINLFIKFHSNSMQFSHIFTIQFSTRKLMPSENCSW